MNSSSTQSLDQIDKFLEMLYEGIPEKTAATYIISNLCKSGNVQKLLKNGNYFIFIIESLIPALSRVLMEDGKRSMDLVRNILITFSSISTFPEYHGIITKNKIGDSCFKVIQRELERIETLFGENSIESVLSQKDEVEAKKLLAMFKKQDALFYYSVEILLNLSSNLEVEVKMVKRDISSKLLEIIGCQQKRSLDIVGIEVLQLTILFLKKLCLYKENMNIVSNFPTIIETIIYIFDIGNQNLTQITLKFMKNMALDAFFRSQCSNKKFISIIFSFLDKEIYYDQAIYILYLLSMDDNCRELFSEVKDAIPFVFDTLIIANEKIT
jgi:hypothetical protein